MLPHPLSRSAPGANPHVPPPLPDLALLLEQHVSAGFPPDLALDLVLNELAVRAADATHATAAALALLRGKQMVCRAATGLHVPELGIPLDARDGLSGACVRTRTVQHSPDTESDPRIDPVISRRLGIRSMLIVPIFDHESVGIDQRPPLTGVLEVFSPFPNTFTEQAQIVLADFADECARICRVATRVKVRPRAEMIPLDEEPASSDIEDGSTGEESIRNGGAGADRGTGAAPVHSEILALPFLSTEETEKDIKASNEDEVTRAPDPDLIPRSINEEDLPPPVAHARQPYELWTLILGGLVILAAAVFSFMIGSRIGWLRTSRPAAISSQIQNGNSTKAPSASAPATNASPAHGKESAKAAPQSKDSQHKSPSKSKPASAPGSDELVVYDKDKVVFRMQPAPVDERKSASPPQTATASSPSPKAHSLTARNAPHSIWLAPAQAESLLLTRVEPQYPADAVADHRSGDVTLEVHVAEDGTVSAVRTLSGDPILAAAAVQAIRNWRYQPYRANDQPSKFQTDVTLTFSLPN